MSALCIFLTFIALKIQSNAQNITINGTSPCDGCAGGTIEDGGDCYNLVTGNVYACRGTFSGGVANGASICAAGYEICPSAARASILGLNETICGSISNNDEFYTSLQSGENVGQCSDSGTNDIWGCARNHESNEVNMNLVRQYPGFGCQDVFVANLYKSGNSVETLPGWKFGSSNNELNTASLTSSSNGGVLCCATTPTTEPTVNPTLEPTQQPTLEPTLQPTLNPTAPTSEPTTSDPSSSPTGSPTTYSPSLLPTTDPTDVPLSIQTTSFPSSEPTELPTTYSPSSSLAVLDTPTQSPNQQDNGEQDVNEEEQVTFIINIYLIIAVLAGIYCLFMCCIGFICYRKHKRNKQKEVEINASKLRVKSVSPELNGNSPRMNSVAMTPVDIGENQFGMNSPEKQSASNMTMAASFGTNLNNLQAANAMLMDDILGEMEMGGNDDDDDDERASLKGHVTKGGLEPPDNFKFNKSNSDDIYDDVIGGFQTMGQ